MRKRRIRYIVVTAVIIVLLLLLAILNVVFLPGLRAHFHDHTFGTLFALLSLVVSIALCGLTLYKYSPGVLTFSKTLQDWVMLAPLFAVLGLACFSIYLAAPGGFDFRWVTTAGALFVVILALITVGGFLMTVTRLEEIHGRILSYPHLVERIGALIDLESYRMQPGKKSSGRLYLLGNAPAMGNVSAPEEFAQLWPKLHTLLGNPKVEVKIACLSWKEDIQGTSPIHRFYYEHWGAAVPEDELQSKIKESLEMISVTEKAPSEFMASRKKELYMLKNTVHEVPFHLFLTSERAILFTALSFPDYSTEALNVGNIRKDDKREVKVIGFETGDRSILDALRKGFDRRLHKIAIKNGASKINTESAPGPSDTPCAISIGNGARTITGLIRHPPKDDRWALICRGLTGSLARRSSLDELADVLERHRWSSLRFDYGNSLNPAQGGHLRTVFTMVEDVSGVLAFMESTLSGINRVPDVVIARGLGARLALEALQPYPMIPLILWAPIFWLRTSLEVRSRLHELRRHGGIEFDGTNIGEQFVQSLVEPTDAEIRSWIMPNRKHIIIQGEDDDVTPLRFALEAKQLIAEAHGHVELKVVLGTHPHPATDVEIQLARIRMALDEIR